MAGQIAETRMAYWVTYHLPAWEGSCYPAKESSTIGPFATFEDAKEAMAPLYEKRAFVTLVTTPDTERQVQMTDTEHHIRQANVVHALVNELNDAVLELATSTTGENVTILVPSGFDAMDNILRQAALVLSTLGMASSVRSQGFDFDPTPSAEGSDRLIVLAKEYANGLRGLGGSDATPFA